MVGVVIATLLVFLALSSGELLLGKAGKNFVRSLGRFMAIIIAGISGEMVHKALVEWGIAFK
ncbi:MAG: hypothetical protein LM590_10940 [Thermofilum sp.]|jgi:multiple antibiotic resistance protein|nr:hypothetical protein [Thermofilum sp.]